MLKLQHYVYLQSLNRTHSIHKSSEEMFISQQALSRAIQKAEQEYGIPFLVRTAHGVTLTEPAQKILEMAQPIIENSKKIESYLQSLQTQPEEAIIRIASIQTFRDYLLPDIQMDMLERHPHIKVQIDPLGTSVIIERISRALYDIGLVGIPFIGDQPLYSISDAIAFTPIMKIQYGFYVGKNSPLASYKSISIASALKYPIIFLEDQIHEPLEQYPPYLMLSQFGTANVIVADSVIYMNKLIESNKGIGIATLHGKWDEVVLPSSILCKPIRDDVCSYPGYLLPKSKPETPALSLFIQSLNNHYLNI